ncbi:carboxypeptidase-like regulatory domain-containing protein [Mucilaginibacter celer]|uniref:Carboxypeptidase-like regulatory domain-containing protein n=1 Tax=Mucilaginibacter celer TaxID=2305508 RepID=A0A494W6F6_9SPHI|nr:carboxypeptidase-like regulatory domain-containing protein [Mucilaginibacter celer]AYL99095.1 hypothetical protein HYN43_029175 [Mucilaginibacter celer]
MFRSALVLIFLFIASFAYAQHSQEGIVYEIKTHIALPGINIENLNGKFKTQTDKQGHFSVPAKGGDLLVFSGMAYKTDTVVVTNLDARYFYLTPKQHQLNEVVINGKGAAAVNQSAFAQPIDPLFHNQTMTYQRNTDGPNADGSVKGGVSFRIWSNKSTENNAKKQAQLEERDRIITKIQQTFADDNISKYVPLKDQELHAFAVRYTPDIKTFTAKEFNLTTYISKCYEEFIKLSPGERLKVPVFEHTEDPVSSN